MYSAACSYIADVRHSATSDERHVLQTAVGAIALVVALGWLASGVYVVDAGEEAVIQRFGKYVETTEAGPRWHFPWPVESRN